MADKPLPHQMRREGPTPAGGAYSIASFSFNGNPCPPDKADGVEITEYAQDGAVVLRTYGRVG